MTLTGRTFHSSESLYQAARFPHDRKLQLYVARLDGRAAKVEARRNSDRTVEDWALRRRAAMFAVLNLKLAVPDVSQCLAETGMSSIVEVTREDCFWGATPVDDFLVGTNLLGRMWMALRSMSRGQEDACHVWATRSTTKLWPHIR